MINASDHILELAQRVLTVEARALDHMRAHLDGPALQQCLRLLDACQGKVVLMGMGKSGLIARKIAATFSSTGTPATFMHPAEALHGDMGFIESKDCVIAISNSGSTDEILALLPAIKKMRCPLVAMTNDLDSLLAQNADVTLHLCVEHEACPMNLAPTVSTMNTLALGDALALTLMQIKGFDSGDFARSHPGGALGRQLLLDVGSIMVSQNLPCLPKETPVLSALERISEAQFGIALVTDVTGSLLGVFTDGDLRRCLLKHQRLDTVTLGQVMTTTPTWVTPETLAYAAKQMMVERKIQAMPVLTQDAPHRVVGLVTQWILRSHKI